MKTRNWVAKHAREFNRATVQRDRKKDYRRQVKHIQQEQRQWIM